MKFPKYPQANDAVRKAVIEQLESGDWTRLEGAPELEKDWESYLGTGHAWFVSSGTDALEAVFLGHDLGPGDEIITTPYTWGASVAAILAIGAIPVFADIDYSTGQIDPECVRKLITDKTKAILAVHLFGMPSPVHKLAKIAAEKGIYFFEDASQAHGAKLTGERVGTFGDGAAFSCMGMKPFGATEGGLAVFKTEEAREKAYLYGRHPRGIDPDRVAALQENGLLDTLQLGWRPSAISAAILRARLPQLDDENDGRRFNARLLRDSLNPETGLQLINELPDAEPVYHLLSFTMDPGKCALSRDVVLARLREEKLPVFPYIPVPVHKMKRLNAKGYEGPPVMWHRWLNHYGIDYSSTTCPMAEKRSEGAFEVSWNFTQRDPESIKEIADAFNRALQP